MKPGRSEAWNTQKARLDGEDRVRRNSRFLIGRMGESEAAAIFKGTR